jgi:hypothetical protein
MATTIPSALLVDGRANIAAALRGSLKLATKYQMENLRNIFIQKIQMEWPTTLAAWDALDKEHTRFFAGAIRDDHYSGVASIIGLANDCNVPSVLPIAFYWLFSLLKSYHYHHDRVLPLLAHEDIQKLVLGGEAINRVLLMPSSNGMGIGEWRCRDSQSPCESCHLQVSLWWTELLAGFAVQGPLELLKFMIEELNLGSGTPMPFGNTCRKVLAERLTRLRRTIFSNLQLYFSLKRRN